MKLSSLLLPLALWVIEIAAVAIPAPLAETNAAENVEAKFTEVSLDCGFGKRDDKFVGGSQDGPFGKRGCNN